MTKSNLFRIQMAGFCVICGIVATVAHAAIPASERQALLNLYSGTNGIGWTNHSNWNGPAGTECTWFGITCDGAQTHVIDIGLSGNNLSGNLPALASLTQLENIDISDNRISGPIPELSGLSNLSNVFAFNNRLSGNIPSIAGLTQLSYFYIYNNQLTGSIPDLSNLPTLCHFNLSGNQLSGSIPAVIQLSNLVIFNVSSNRLTGGLPELTGLSNLSVFSVGRNQLTGTVPSLPSSATLASGQSTLCPNPLTTGASASWNAATGFSPWWAVPYSTNLCDDVFTSGFD